MSISMRLLSLVVLCVSATVSGGIETYFKPVENKSMQNSMRNIDFIYMINLDERPEKFARSSEELNKYNIYPCRFSAVNGWKLPLAGINEIGIKYTPGMREALWGTSYLTESMNAEHEIMQVRGKNYFSHCLSRGAIGIVLSHMSILKDALDSGYKTIWVMEDDVQVAKDPRALTYLISRLDKVVGKRKWDILFTDPDTKNAEGKYIPCTAYAQRPNFSPMNPERFAIKEDVSKDFTKVGARYGAYSMIIRRSGMKKIYNFIKNYGVFLPYDMEFYLPNDIRLYSTRYDVVSTLPKALSDNGAPNYERNVSP